MTEKADRDKLHDATKPLAVDVIAADHLGAVRCSPTRCVYANALRRLSGVQDARVGVTSMRLLRRDGWHRYDIEKNTRATIGAYDRAGQLMPPGMRAIFLPPQNPLGARRGERPGTNKRSGAGNVTNRRPSSRHIDVEPPESEDGR